MSESYPVKERIVQAVCAALERIAPSNGFVTAGVTVLRPRRTGERFTPAAHGIAVLQGDETREPNEDLIGHPPAIGWRLSITCDLVVRHSEKDPRPMDQVLNLFEADVRKALLQDVQWGGLAIGTELGRTSYPEAADGVEGLTVWLEVLYRVAENDPYVNRA